MKKYSGLKSILEPVVQEVNVLLKNKTPYSEIKQLVINRIQARNINELDKKKMILDIQRQTSEYGLIKYLYNAILKFEGFGTIRSFGSTDSLKMELSKVE